MFELRNLQHRLNHRFAAANLSAFLDGELSGRDRARVQRHLQGCATCQSEVESLRETVAQLRSLPLRPLPRSFVLPLAAQPEQRRYRRWHAAQGFMRSATVAVTLMLVLLLSSDALIGTGAVPLPDMMRPRQPATSSESPSERTMLSQDAAAGQAAPESEVEATAPVSGEPEVASLKAAPAEDEPSASVAAAPQAEPTPMAQAEAPTGAGELEGAAPSFSPPEGAYVTGEERGGAGGMGGGAEGYGGGYGVAGEVEAEIAVEKMAAEPTPETPAPTVAALEEETPQEDSATPVEDDLAMRAAEPTQEASEPAPLVEASPTLSPMWIVWRVVRLASGVLAGLLLVLVAGLLFTSQQARL
ncbi:MAG: anti-sigma factor family protein [Anaerolineae bacterium]